MGAEARLRTEERQTPASRECPNCGAELQGPYCAQCGQKGDAHVPSLKELLHEAAEELFHLDSKLLRSLGLLFRRPGALTQAYWAGQRARYLGPVKLYLAASLVFFLAWGGIRRTSVVQVAIQTDSGLKLSYRDGPPPDLATARAELAKDPDLRHHPWIRGILDHVVAGISRGDSYVSAAVNRAIQNFLPDAMFLLIPLFALLVQLAFQGSRRFYVEHLIGALHLHTFAFLALSISVLPWSHVAVLAEAAVLVYLWLSLRRLYGEGWLRTSLKALALLVVYGLSLGVALGAITLWALAQTPLA